MFISIKNLLKYKKIFKLEKFQDGDFYRVRNEYAIWVDGDLISGFAGGKEGYDVITGAVNEDMVMFSAAPDEKFDFSIYRMQNRNQLKDLR